MFRRFLSHQSQHSKHMRPLAECQLRAAAQIRWNCRWWSEICKQGAKEFQAHSMLYLLFSIFFWYFAEKYIVDGICKMVLISHYILPRCSQSILAILEQTQFQCRHIEFDHETYMNCLYFKLKQVQAWPLLKKKIILKMLNYSHKISKCKFFSFIHCLRKLQKYLQPHPRPHRPH